VAGITIILGERIPSISTQAKKSLLLRIAGKLVAGPSDNSMSSQMYRRALSSDAAVR
jgi:hypothetical protein